MEKTTDFTKTIDAAVLASGDYPTRAELQELLRTAPFVVCCDGAANEYIGRGNMPDLIVGDGDSLSAENREKFAERLVRISEQETNDQTKAVTHLQSLGKRRIAILGATGKREDHTLGNISLLIEYMRMGIEVRTLTDHGEFIPCRDTVTLSTRAGQQLSIFNITASGMNADGLVYPIRDFNLWWQGTLNECTGSEVTIHAEGEYLVYLNRD